MRGHDHLEASFEGGILQASQERLNFAESEEIARFVQKEDAMPFSGYGERGFQNDQRDLAKREFVEPKFQFGRSENAPQNFRVSGINGFE